MKKAKSQLPDNNKNGLHHHSDNDDDGRRAQPDNLSRKKAQPPQPGKKQFVIKPFKGTTPSLLDPKPLV